jgi:predicted transcriptional regulator
MTKKEAFIKEVEWVLENTTFAFSDQAMNFFNDLKITKEKEKPPITEKGVAILQAMRDNKDKYNNVFKAKDVAEIMFCSSRSVSGSMRKLVTDGFVDKAGTDPTVYSLTEKGETCSLEVKVDESENF